MQAQLFLENIPLCKGNRGTKAAGHENAEANGREEHTVNIFSTCRSEKGKRGGKKIKAYVCQGRKSCRLRCVCKTAWWSLAACWASVRGGSVIISLTAASSCFSDPVACGVVHPAPEVVSSSAACKPASCNRVSWSSWVVTFCWGNAARQGCGSVAGVKQNAVHQTFMRHFARGCILKE